MNRNLLLLSLCQGLFLTNNIVFIAINGLVGLQLAPLGWMATLPVTGYVVGAALSAPLVAKLQQRYGRKACFQMGLVVAAMAAAGCALAVLNRQFWPLVACTLVAGFYSANAALYRFAGPELVSADYKEKAISWVLAGGIVGAFIGPNLATATRQWLSVPFAGAYVSLVAVALISLFLLSFIQFPAPAKAAGPAQVARPLSELMRRPPFWVAVMAASLGYGVMNLLMAATPLAMQQCKLPFESAALVLEWHVLGMFAPGFFTGHLIKRFGPLPIMAAGIVLNLACVAIALSGVDLMQFLWALVLLGVGWNFLYTAATSLFTTAYRPEEKFKAQAAMDSTVAATMAITSFASGALVTTQGWAWLNVGSLVPMVVVAGALAWLMWAKSTAPMGT